MDLTGERLHLFVAESEGVVCSAAIFVHTGDIIQYHLSGSDPQYGRLAPSKLVLDQARLWGNTTGAEFLHLGGGVGSRADGLLLFKAGFSPLRHQFSTWKWIVQHGVYARLVDARRKWLGARAAQLETSSFFPVIL